MKRFGRYDSDYNNLFECYSKVQPGLIREVSLPSMTRQKITKSHGNSYPELETVKIFIQQPGRGADLRHQVSNCEVMSDDGDGGVVLTGEDGRDTIHAVLTKRDAQIKVIDSNDGHVENEFITTIQPKFDSDQKELRIIHVEEL